MKIQFSLSRPNNLKYSSVIAIVRYKNFRLNYATGISVNPQFWDPENNCLKRNKLYPGYKTINPKLVDIGSKILNVFIDFQNQNNDLLPDKSVLKELLDKKFRRSIQSNQLAHTFLSFLKEIIDKSKDGTRIHPKTGKPISHNTIKTYTTTYKHLDEFSKVNNQKLYFGDISLGFYEDYKKYLIKKKIMSNNTVGKHFQIIKLVMNEAIERGLTNNNAFKNKRFYVIRENADNVFLTENEIIEICSTDFTKRKNLDVTRDLFVIACMTGLRYSDFSSLKPDQINNGFISISQSKTGDNVVIPIHPVVEKILSKYQHVLPRAYSNQKTNVYLKELCEEIECLNASVSKTITKGGKSILITLPKWNFVTTHTARRSFATNEIKKGTPVSIVMAITGHKTEKSFWKYIKLTKSDYAVMLQTIWNERSIIKSAQA